MLNLCNYDAYYHSVMTFSPLEWHFTKVHILALFRVNYVLYWCLTLSSSKNLKLTILLELNFQDFSGWLKKRLEKENDGKNQKSTLGGWPNLAFKVKLE